MDKIIATPHSILWSYFGLLRRLVNELDSIEDPKRKREQVFLIIILSVTIVESFFNLFFTLLVNEKKYSNYRLQIINEAKSNLFSFDKKIKEWPKLLFDNKLDLEKGSGQKFITLKNLRNKLIHFLPNYNNLEIENIRIESLVDISIYENLENYDAYNCPNMVLDFAIELFRTARLPEDHHGQLIQLWFGDMSKIIFNK